MFEIKVGDSRISLGLVVLSRYAEIEICVAQRIRMISSSMPRLEYYETTLARFDYYGLQII